MKYTHEIKVKFTSLLISTVFFKQQQYLDFIVLICNYFHRCGLENSETLYSKLFLKILINCDFVSNTKHAESIC